MRRLFAYFMVLFMGMAATASAAQCLVDARAAVSKSSYFAQNFTSVAGSTQGSLTMQHKEDPRILVNFAIAVPQPSAGRSVQTYLQSARDEFAPYINAVKAEGRWIELTTFPYEPIAWRIVEETTLPDVGPVLAGRMYIRLSEDCLLSANFVAPTSINLRSRWHAFSDAIANLRTDLQSMTQPTKWANEDTTPTGVSALAIGFVSPIFVAIAAFFLLGHLTRLDRPSVYTRTVLACVGVIMLGALAYQSSAYMEGLKTIRYTDNALLIGLTGIICLVALAFRQAMTVLALTMACIVGMTLISLSFLEWTPDPNVSFAVGGAATAMGVLGFLSWSLGNAEDLRNPFNRDRN